MAYTLIIRVLDDPSAELAPPELMDSETSDSPRKITKTNRLVDVQMPLTDVIGLLARKQQVDPDELERYYIPLVCKSDTSQLSSSLSSSDVRPSVPLVYPRASLSSRSSPHAGICCRPVLSGLSLAQAPIEATSLGCKYEETPRAMWKVVQVFQPSYLQRHILRELGFEIGQLLFPSAHSMLVPLVQSVFGACSHGVAKSVARRACPILTDAHRSPMICLLPPGALVAGAMFMADAEQSDETGLADITWWEALGVSQSQLEPACALSSAAASPVTLDDEQPTVDQSLVTCSLTPFPNALEHGSTARSVSDRGDGRDLDEGLAQKVEGTVDATGTAHGHLRAPAIVAIMITITSVGEPGTNV
ncbi:hypothetical protein FOZ61_006778 [Perkinsus olseni]|uniref:Uncharacterized protein n=1 Tax=Perkinsus olseni TaxID=32597 RepID=A0A7J6LBK4_PEROL|nr:hypothetical protein FOZ61_006778 [Perkinsus olseni]